MKASKCLIFKVNDQKFAIKTSCVLNIIEKARMVNEQAVNGFHKPAIAFRGMTLPLIDMREILGMQPSEEQINDCVLVVEVRMNDKLQIVGIAIDEVTEVTELDDFMAYPYMPLINGNTYDFREAVIVRNNEPVIIINGGKLHYKHIIQHSGGLKVPVSVN